jgi:hypothetical protein
VRRIEHVSKTRRRERFLPPSGHDGEAIGRPMRRFVCVLCKHVTFAGSDGASRFPFTFDKVAAGR